MSKGQYIKSTVLVMIITILSKISGFGVDALIAYKYGPSFSSDVFVFVYGLTTIVFVSVGRAIGSVFIPLLTELKINATVGTRNKFINNVLNLFILILLCISILGIIFAKYIVIVLGPGFINNYSQQEFEQVVLATRIIMVSLMFIGIQSVFVGVLNAFKEFAVASSIAVFSNLVIIIYLFFFNNIFGLIGLIIALLISVIIQGVVLFPSLKKHQYRYQFKLDLKDTQLIEMFKNLPPVLLGSSILQINMMVDRMLATTISQGALALLNFASKLNLIITHVLGMAIATIVYPIFSEKLSQNDQLGFKITLIKSINITNLLIIPSSVGLVVLGEPIIRIIYERGAFGPSATKVTAELLCFYALAMMVFSLREILNRCFYSLKDTKTPMKNSILGVLINITLNLIFIKILGLNGIALSSSISATIVTLLLFVSLKRKFKIPVSGMVLNALKVLIASGIMGLVVHFLYNPFLLYINNEVITLLMIIILGSLLYVSLIYFLRIEEYQQLIGIIRKKIAK
ncbi:hypothetical protein ASG97_02630 [Bacillus sp. Soil745]|nr:hypothetical protein ASG97_02630 [Bacillus sp. Soil745]